MSTRPLRLVRPLAPAMLLAAVLLGGCSARPQPPVTAAAGAPGEGAAAGGTAGLEQALERAIAEPGADESLRLAAECRRDAGLVGMRVYGNGVGIWNDERQFRLDPVQVAGLLRILEDADFLAFEDVYGGPPPPPKPPPGDGDAMATVVTCRVELALAGHEKRALQLEKGEQSPLLKRLAEDLLAACETPARSGVTAASLRDGLEKVARGELAPEAWVVVLHRVPELGAQGDGFLLRVLGSDVSVQTYDAQAGYRDPALMELHPEQIRALAAELAGRDPAAWPGNLYARDYTDLSVRVLNHEKSIQARQFAGMAPGSHAPHQQAFEEVYTLLDRLRSTVLAQAATAAQSGR